MHYDGTSLFQLPIPVLLLFAGILLEKQAGRLGWRLP